MRETENRPQRSFDRIEYLRYMGHGILVSHLVEKFRGDDPDDDETEIDDDETGTAEDSKT